MIHIENKRTRILAIVVAVVLILVMEVPLVHHYTEETSFDETISVLEEQQDNLTKMTLGAVTASTVLAMVPSDVTTPVANELADLTSLFAVALAAVLLEKFLLTKLCWLSLRIILPVGILLVLAFVTLGRRGYFHIGLRVLLVGILFMVIIPLGAGVSQAVEEVYQDKLDAAVSISDEVSAEKATETLTEEQATAEAKAAEKEGMSWKDVVHIVTGLPQTVADSAQSLTTALSSGVNELVERAETWIQVLEFGLAVVIISTIVIPVGVLMLGLWFVRTVTGIPLPAPTPGMLGKRRHPKPGIKPDDLPE